MSKQRVKPLERKVFNVGGKEKELFMSFAAHQKILNLAGGLDNVVNAFTDPNTQMQIVAVLVFGKQQPEYETASELQNLLEDTNLSTAEALEILDWAQDFIVDFTFAQIKGLSDKYQNQAKAVGKDLKNTVLPLM